MAGLAESIWANAPSTPSISTGQNATKPSREPRTATTPTSRNANRRRGRGGAGNKQPRQTGSDDTLLATQPTPTTTQSSTSTTKPAKPTSTTTLPTRPRAPPHRKSDLATTRKSGSINPISGTNTAPPAAKDETAASDSGSASARKAPRKRAQKPAGRRKGSLAISTTSSVNDPLSTIIEPATPMTTSVVASTQASPIEAAGSQVTSHSSLGPGAVSPTTSISELKTLSVTHPSVALHLSTVRPSTPASASHLDWADDDDADDLPDLDDWAVAPVKDEEPRAPVQRRRSSAAKTQAQLEVLEDHGQLAASQEVVSSDVSDSVSPTSPTTTGDNETVASSAESVKPTGAATITLKPRKVRPVLTEEQAAEKKKIKNREARERRKAKKTTAEGVDASKGPKSASPKSAAGDLASRIGEFAIDESKPSSSHPSKDASANSHSSLPTKPESAAANADSPTSSLPARPSLPSNPSATGSPSGSNFPPRRKPFAGEQSFLSGQRHQGRGGPDSGSGGPRSSGGGRKERPASHHVSRPVISQNALSQLTKSLSGGARTHRPLTAE